MEDVEALVALERTGSVSEAARMLGISQQACSARLKKLSQRVGCALTVRVAQGVELSDAGRVVVGWAQPMLAARQEFDRLVATLSPREKGLRVGASLTVAEYLLPGWLPEGMAPEGVRVLTANSREVIRAVECGEVVAGFVETPHVPRGLRSRRVGWDELVVCVAPGHEWAGCSVSARELAATPLVVREEGSGTRETVEQALGCLAVPAAQVRSTAAAVAVVRAGIAPAVLSRRVVADDVERGLLEVVPVGEVQFLRPITAVWLLEKLPQQVMNMIGGAEK